jgi:peptidoglycan/xylan/chitin deacetylase (PgdA/CDA1 family)
LFAPSVYHGDRSRRSIALTFDDGPTQGTLELLDVLERSGARATFFQCGTQVGRLPEVAREVQSRGHEIGNHSHTHARLYLRSAAFIRDEIARAQDAIATATGRTPVLFRAPYGVRWFGMRTVQRELGLMGVMWTALGRDWRLGGEAVAARVTAAARAGAIICLHDGRELMSDPDISNTVDAVRRAVPLLIDRGFRFETVSDILCPKT